MSDCVIKTLPLTGQTADLAELFRGRRHLAVLDSSLVNKDTGRFSFVGFDPFAVFSGDDPESLLAFQKVMERFRVKPHPVIPFTGGCIGYVSYDLGAQWQGIGQKDKADIPVPGWWFGVYDCILALDHHVKKLHVCSTGFPGTNAASRRKRARARVEEICEALHHLRKQRPPNEVRSRPVAFKSDFTKAGYVNAVRRALDHIRRGDIYQVNLSHRITVTPTGQADPLRMYRDLRRLSPSSFGAFLDCGPFQVLSSSPERFLQLRRGIAQIRPMKGTRPRSPDRRKDRASKKELIDSPKEIAELLMVTDLERNDLGRVCRFGSVRVSAMRTIEDYATVFQATATIEGKLARGKTPFDAVAACFPGGSVTGCPKLRAMDIIDRLEHHRRDLYCGALGYTSFAGDMDFNILIRTLLVTPRRITFHVGGGIVADSDPEREYEETWVKARAIMDCLRRNL